MKKHIKNIIVIKILDSSKIIGDIQIIENPDKNYYLRVISITPEYQGLGIGQKSIEYIESELCDAKEWNLITPFKSFRNHHFYEKMGYQKIGEYKHSEVLVMYKYRKVVRK